MTFVTLTTQCTEIESVPPENIERVQFVVLEKVIKIHFLDYDGKILSHAEVGKSSVQILKNLL